MQDCLFCKIAAGEIPSQRVYENDSTIAFMDINPWTKGHCLVVSKEHAATIFELSEESALGIMRVAHRLAPAVKAAVGAEGMNLLQSNGRAAWQTVDHVHLHLIPRWFNDPLVPPVAPSPGDPDQIAETAGQIRALVG
jgi:histidine triad (HIT) family protein